MQTKALLITINGVVQGVGFRPFVYRLAHRLGLAGTVANNGDGVHIHASGSLAALDDFVLALKSEAPPIARIVRFEVLSTELPTTSSEFRILPSVQGLQPSTQIAPDIALCNDCLAEIFDPTNRRFRYPFTNCTNCGPRFSIVERIPYDRPNTSMRVFPLCEACDREYHDPMDRRFHAQPNACPVCGPRLSWHDGSGQLIDGDCLDLAACALAEGQVVAIKGLGGFHLAADAGSAAAVATLRMRKRRPGKPLAIMVRDLETAARFCHISPAEADLLTSPEHPIVLLERKFTAPLVQDVAPGLGVLGVMLPYTPLHHLLLHQKQTPVALVMTSGNRSDEPICTGNHEALTRLHGLADFFLLHDREIVTRVDDSVARVMAGKTRLLRRARGYSPVPILLRQPTADILACGAEMKNSFCIVRNQEAYISQHIGELTSPESYDFYRESIDHLQTVLEVAPPQAACDLHPDYLSTRYAHSRPIPCRGVQHHHAHTGAVMAEHGLEGPLLSVVLDGTGFSTDGTVFGGEIYRADRIGFQRLGRLSHLLLPGGDRAAREPWRMALALLYQALGPTALLEANQPPALLTIDPAKKQLLGQMMAKGLNCPRTSSCGRLFDAVSALLGLCLESQHEGQAAMLLEHQATLAPPRHGHPNYPSALREEQGVWVIESAPLVPLMLHDLASGVAIPVIAHGFHLWLAQSLRLLLETLQQQTGLSELVLSGGCMQNKLLFETLAETLPQCGFTVFAGELVPMNDGGIALGQAFTGGTTLCV
ncbi:MAG: carbamoyltransferase HypF [Desulfobulbaceae bacterium]|nr:carbamoyltransferase HypF [Desulfobulbaceae bacterium]